MQYSKELMDHFKNPRNQGQLENPDATGEEGNPVCGDVMKIYIQVEDNKIKDIKFETMGCAAAIAVSSVMTELIKGKDLKEARNITRDEIVDALGGLPETKVHCSMLGIDALKGAIKNYNEKMIK